MFLENGYMHLLEAKTTLRTEVQCVQVFWARLARYGQLGLTSDLRVVSKFHTKIHGPKGQESTICTLVNATAATQSQ